MSSRSAAALHEEHLATETFLDRLEAMSATPGGRRPDVADPAVAQVLRSSAAALGMELGRHFDFEERPLFEHLAGLGEGEIVAQLLAEHGAIRPIAAELARRGATALQAGFTDGSWDEYRALAAELCALLRSHVEIEERMLLPLLDETLDADSDARFHADYAGNV
ncbi:MAG TPA: hemerythrin domain-containing protein [Steroidobacteraceae bacterium]|nr:hemerythrin domain-containing protein [Steroidobacteraceae bacterium]